MTDNLEIFPNKTTDPDAILQKAREWGLTEVIVIGWDKDEKFRFGGSNGALRDISWLLKNAEMQLQELMEECN